MIHTTFIPQLQGMNLWYLLVFVTEAMALHDPRGDKMPITSLLSRGDTFLLGMRRLYSHYGKEILS